eukprot:CAMPEP_0181315224 /NCGR_PEP_ID=MMETSP1101-20121128/15255_1 /TAXON_ID=46948 /ORGANISM="Rhodomonas abbreviata, Strain Caron Lab Isolate" /LENGTH=62 /DNA_ID=CAMNT_0023422405 /DNA_START=171 /DNA_END=359 /DNA_ORIENTATION=-
MPRQSALALSYPNEVVNFPESEGCANSVACNGMWSWYWTGPVTSSDGYSEYVNEVPYPAPME